MAGNSCPKCGSTDLKPPRHFRARGIGTNADLNIICCNECSYSESYEIDAEERAPIKKRIAMVWLFLVL